MLLFTSVAHFNSLRHDLARMIPPGVPSPMGMVYFTGLCEIAGAIGLLVPRTRRAAAVALIVFFLAILPANIHAARAGLTLAGKPGDPGRGARRRCRSCSSPSPGGRGSARRATLIRAEEPGDRAAIFGVVRDAFGRDDEARLVDALRASDAFIPELSLVALDGASDRRPCPVHAPRHPGRGCVARRARARPGRGRAVPPAEGDRVGADPPRPRGGAARWGTRVVIVVGHPSTTRGSASSPPRREASARRSR